MAKKQRISPIADFQINTDITVGNLPAPDQVNETIAVLTGKPLPVPAPSAEKSVPEPIPVHIIAPEVEKTEVLPPPAVPIEKKNPKKATVVRTVKPSPPPVAEPVRDIRYGRPQKEVAIGRTKFTTMLQPDIVKQLKRTAIDKGETVADLLEHIIGQYFSK